ncbi:MAG: deoxyribodipyrimidine photo-lyase [Candidatus Binatia bacterium]
MRIVHWFRNDLRLEDNTALAAAAAAADELIPVFVVDTALLAVHRSALRLRFFAECLAALAAELARQGCPLVVRRGDPCAEIARLLAETRAERLTFNRDYTPYARRRDAAICARAQGLGVETQSHKDRVVFESGELRTRSGQGFSVYTPYRRAWLERYHAVPAARARAPRLPKGVPGVRSEPVPTAADFGVLGDQSDIPRAGEVAAAARLRRFICAALRDYDSGRDRPAIDGTSRLSPYLRCGALSVRRCVHEAYAAAAAEPRAARGAERWVAELIWREFYTALLAEHPRVLRGAFKPAFARIAWNDDPRGFDAWCAGRTGYPFVDAGMRQLVRTGWMHNRARMVAASFLTKDLLVDWRAGERFFMRHLVDGDPAANNGGWQWAASTGTDAQPYFRIFNPTLQGQKFDPDGAYARQWLPELRDVPARYIHEPWRAPATAREYPPPIVDHAERRVAAIARYEAARQQTT